YPTFESLDIKDVTHLREIPLRQTRFIADINIRDIVKYMRALGLDVYYDALLSPREIIRISKRENRTILTKSRKLLKFRDVTHGIFIRPGTTVEQIRGIIDYLSLRELIEPFSRCLQCNKPLIEVSKDRILDRIPPKTREFCDEYSYCKACNRIYWKGTHYMKIKKVIDEILGK
ncbi:MAG: Mut7-C RNAse domain-containing protein, partial [Deltaproteobacteria bacterium]|nr:Mut7-C RNAse domain-containing protein [Deltaproteobacteria bacterium]